MATKKSASKGGGKTAARSAATRIHPITPYGVAIRDALASGNAASQKRVAADARKHLRDVKAALAKLDKALGKGK